MFINSFILAISSSIDAFGIGITYGIKNTKISYISKVVLFAISFVISIISIWFGDMIKNIFSDSIIRFIGSSILILMGIFICFQSIHKEKSSNKFTDITNLNEEKVYSFFINFLGITIKIIKNPSYSDLNNSNTIEPKEAFFLSLALSLDSFCIGTCGSIIGINSIAFPILISSFQLVFLQFGNLLGRKLHSFTKLPQNIWSFISGILLIIIGIIRIYI